MMRTKYYSKSNKNLCLTIILIIFSCKKLNIIKNIQYDDILYDYDTVLAHLMAYLRGLKIDYLRNFPFITL